LKPIKEHNFFSFVKAAKYAKDILYASKISTEHGRHVLIQKEHNQFFLSLFLAGPQKNHENNAGKISVPVSVSFKKRFAKLT
jgi:hypothetical protein